MLLSTPAVCRERSQTSMLTVDCPWCEDRMVLDDAPDTSMTCAACDVRVELAPDPVDGPLVLAA
jgi:ribosomal protein S27E